MNKGKKVAKLLNTLSKNRTIPLEDIDTLEKNIKYKQLEKLNGNVFTNYIDLLETTNEYNVK